MNSNEFAGFAKIWTATTEMVSRRELSDSALKLAFSALSDFELVDISYALEKHIRGERGRFPPTPADVIQHLHGEMPPNSTLIALARQCDTPLGMFSRLIIGKWDLDNQDSFYLAQRAEEVKLKLPEFLRNARLGKYDERMRTAMSQKNIDPKAEIAPGIPAPRLVSPDLKLVKDE